MYILLISIRCDLCHVGNTLAFSLFDTPQYTELPQCARLPFAEGCDFLECPTNNCFCRPDLVRSAISTVSSNANAACSSIAPAGVGSALAVIVNYCTSNGFVVSTSLPTSTALPGGFFLRQIFVYGDGSPPFI